MSIGDDFSIFGTVKYDTKPTCRCSYFYYHNVKAQLGQLGLMASRDEQTSPALPRPPKSLMSSTVLFALAG